MIQGAELRAMLTCTYFHTAGGQCHSQAALYSCTSTCVRIPGHPQSDKLQRFTEDTEHGRQSVSSSQFMAALEQPTEMEQMWLMAIMAQGFCPLALSPSGN